MPTDHVPRVRIKPELSQCLGFDMSNVSGSRTLLPKRCQPPINPPGRSNAETVRWEELYRKKTTPHLYGSLSEVGSILCAQNGMWIENVGLQIVKTPVCGEQQCVQSRQAKSSMFTFPNKSGKTEGEKSNWGLCCHRRFAQTPNISCYRHK